jgi:hypothetical protein
MINSRIWIKVPPFKSLKMRFTASDNLALDRIKKLYSDETKHLHVLVAGVPTGAQEMFPVQNALVTAKDTTSILVSYQSPRAGLPQNEVGYTLAEIKAPNTPAGAAETTQLISQFVLTFNFNNA